LGVRQVSVLRSSRTGVLTVRHGVFLIEIKMWDAAPSDVPTWWNADWRVRN
jgi:hypothetical protein